LVSKEYKKIERVVSFMKKGLTYLSDDLEETVKGINDFKKSLNKALKDLKDVSSEPELKTVSSSSKRVVAPTDGTAKTAAASTLFSLLSGSPAPAQEIPAATAATTSPTVGGPSTTLGKGPPKRPATGVPPTAPSSGGPPQRANLPPAPKLPPSSGHIPPQAPSAGAVPTPSFAKRPMPPAAPTAGPPAAPAAPQAGGGLGSLRDEMLEELNRLKKIMRGD
jgi:hypothetical protein